jgi:hypothetical protein
MNFLQNNTKNIEAINCDITPDNFSLETSCNIVILNHVLENLEEPGMFLKSIRQRLDFELIIIEVPLKDFLIRRLRDRFRDRSMNIAGHIKFFTIDGFEQLLISNGYSIKDRRQYLSIMDLPTLRFVSGKNRLSKYQYMVKVLTNIFLPRRFSPLLKHLYYSHYAVLCCIE